MSSMRHIHLVFVVFVVALATMVPSVLKARATEQQMIVSVLDTDGAPVEGLGPADFTVREDGAAREVLQVGPVPDGRQIALLVDTSEAAVHAVVDLRKGLTAFIEAMYEGNDISLISYGGAPRILVESTNNLSRLRDGANSLFAFPGYAAYLLDAISETARGFNRREMEHPVMVVLTTEGLDYSNVDPRRVLDQLNESGAAVHTVVLLGQTDGFSAADFTTPQVELQHRRFERDLVLARGPDQSGGSRRDLLASFAIERAMIEVATELRHQYLITYSRPDALIPPEDIEVSVTGAEMTTRGTPLKVG